MSKQKLDRKTRRAITKMVKEATDTTQFSSAWGNTKSYFSKTGTVNITANGVSLSAGNNSPPPRSTELPLIKGQLYVSDYTVEKLQNHLKVAKVFLDFDWTMVKRATNENELSYNQLAFYTEEDKQCFVAWMNDYLAKFGDHSDLMTPPPSSGSFPYLVRRKNFIEDRDSSSLRDEWIWILNNCVGEARHTGDFWFFAENDDATLFKLTYA